ncbi:hypothetical protein GCM10011333_03230 [Sediminivirga luteola]|uniref:SAF domain-containing protein n=2 Tax=Sediminivirga luteola TaxID=1774748 RepID=A0A8J2TVJ0_9MICO|nr:hypothetical protein GCM10011333_03230 [Sediminivirga luteola]
MAGMSSLLSALGGLAGRLRSRFPAVPPRLRRPAAAALLALATVLLAHALVPGGGTVAIAVAARDLPPGAELRAGDLAMAEYPPGLVPAGAVEDADVAVGRVLAAPMNAGAPLTAAALLGAASSGGAEGSMLMPLRFADPSASVLLQPGSRIRVFAAPLEGLGGDAELLLESAWVASVSREDVAALAAGGGTVVTVAVSPEEASVLASASGSPLSFALIGDGSHTGEMLSGP